MSQQAAHQSRFRSVFHTNPGHREPMGLTDSEKHGGSRPAQEPGQLPTHNGNARQGRNGSVYNHNGHKVSKGIEPDGESGRRGFHPIMFPLICARSSSRVSMITNILWPFTIAAFILHYTTENHLWVFICAYLGLVPAANLLGFAAQELARKLPTVVGVLVECLCGALVELILFIVLIVRHTENTIIKDAIVGSLLANLLLCLGACFFIGGVFTKQQHLHEAITEVGCNLLFLCGVGLSIPTIFYQSLNNGSFDTDLISDLTLSISHATAIVLLVAYVLWIFFQASSHHGLYEDLYRSDELADNDRDKDLAKKKLTLTECIAAIVIGALFVCFMAVFLVEQLPVSMLSNCWELTLTIHYSICMRKGVSRISSLVSCFFHWWKRLQKDLWLSTNLTTTQPISHLPTFSDHLCPQHSSMLHLRF